MLPSSDLFTVDSPPLLNPMFIILTTGRTREPTTPLMQTLQFFRSGSFKTCSSLEYFITLGWNDLPKGNTVA